MGIFRGVFCLFVFLGFLEEEKGNLQENDVRSGFFCCETFIKGL